MSYESRAKKRRYKRTEAKVSRQRSAETAGRWFLIVAKHPGRCDRCRSKFKRGDDVVYRHDSQLTRCESCASRDPESRGFGLSLKYERYKARQLQQQLAA
jgi:hypothetical protein